MDVLSHLFWTKWSERAKPAHSMSYNVDIAGQKILPVPIHATGVNSLCVCLCVHPHFGRCWISFEQMDQFGWNYQGIVDWSGLTYGWVVTSAQFPPGWTWPASSPFPWRLSAPRSLVLAGHAILESKQNYETGFFIFGLDMHLWVMRVETWGGGVIFWEWVNV